MRHCLVLAGGSGTRLWPWSTAGLPKQLVPMLDGGRSLLDAAVERATAVVPAERVWLGCGEQLREAVAGFRSDRLVVEPSGRDTLPAVALGMATIAATDPDAVVAVLTADHLIEPVEDFARVLSDGFALAEQRADVLVTFGVVPDHPATGFGYLDLGAPLAGEARVVDAFREKPDAATAAELVGRGCLWNSGMFVWRAATLLAAVDAFAPEVGALVRRVAAGDLAAWDDVPKQSVDYGVMEPASASDAFTVAALPLDLSWRDVGSWPAYGDALGRDADGSAVRGQAVLLDAPGSTVVSSDPSHLVAVVGVEGLVVVHTPTATLVVPADQAQRVKEVQARVAAEHPDLA